MPLFHSLPSFRPGNTLCVEEEFFFLLRKQQEGSPLMLCIFALGLEASFPLTNPAETRQQCRL